MAANLACKAFLCARASTVRASVHGFIVQVPKSNLHLISATLKPRITTGQGCPSHAVPECRAFPFVCRFHLHMMQPPCVESGTVISSDSSICNFPTLFKVLCRRSDIKPVPLTNVYSAVPHPCRSVRPTLSLSLAARHNTPSDLQ